MKKAAKIATTASDDARTKKKSIGQWLKFSGANRFK